MKPTELFRMHLKIYSNRLTIAQPLGWLRERWYLKPPVYLVQKRDTPFQSQNYLFYFIMAGQLQIFTAIPPLDYGVDNVRMVCGQVPVTETQECSPVLNEC